MEVRFPVEMGARPGSGSRSISFATSAALLALSLLACAKLGEFEKVVDIAGAANGPPLADNADAGSLPDTPVGIDIRPSKLELKTTCNLQSESRPITIQNTTDKPIDYKVEVPADAMITLHDDKDAPIGMIVSGMIEPGALATVRATVKSGKAGTTLGQISVTAAGTALNIPAQVTISGGALVIGQDTLNFGDVKQHTAGVEQMFEVENTGNEPVTVESWVGVPAGTDFSMQSGSLTIPAGEKKAVTATFESGAEGPELSATFSPKPQLPLCGDTPSLIVRGRRVNTSVTISPATADFGEVSCNTTTNTTRKITITNYNTTTGGTYDVTLPADTWFTAPASGPIPAGGPVEVLIGLKPTQAVVQSKDEQISIATHVGSENNTKVVTASVKVVGAVVEITPVTLTGFAPNQTKHFDVKNTGNKFVYLKHASSESAFNLPHTSTPLQPKGSFGSSVEVDVKFVEIAAGDYASNITTTRTDTPLLEQLLFPQSATLCNVPAVVAASATIAPLP